ncbi:hypothetical protein C8P66_12766 [Humitalea rosea]|uniref:Uncharacterized protein n=1 Tax=Humitalea rosea TaxID=990373 RepID=A0A2W7IML9_9PROT|nr:hypothetical protein [Humitalea rosea]PZW39863.1 hypothetical protein C8P66_12766 [Humitalea rosea]
MSDFRSTGPRSPQPGRPDPVILDMAPDGSFREAPRAAPMDRALGGIGGVAMGVAGVALALSLGALAFLALTVLVPVVLVAGSIAAVTIWWRLRRLRQQGGSIQFVMRR